MRLQSIIESLIFASDKPLTVKQLKTLTGTAQSELIRSALEDLQAECRESGIQLVEVGGGYQFRTHPDNATWVRRLLAGRPPRLTQAMLETLAIVAYRQPVTRPEVEDIRGVDCGGVLRLLLERNLVRVVGKKEEVGRPLLYGTTKYFLEFFNLSDLKYLPTLKEFTELSEESAEELELTCGGDAEEALTTAAELLVSDSDAEPGTLPEGGGAEPLQVAADLGGDLAAAAQPAADQTGADTAAAPEVMEPAPAEPALAEQDAASTPEAAAKGFAEGGEPSDGNGQRLMAAAVDRSSAGSGEGGQDSAGGPGGLDESWARPAPVLAVEGAEGEEDDASIAALERAMERVESVLRTQQHDERTRLQATVAALTGQAAQAAPPPLPARPARRRAASGAEEQPAASESPGSEEGSTR